MADFEIIFYFEASRTQKVHKRKVRVPNELSKNKIGIN